MNSDITEVRGLVERLRRERDEARRTVFLVTRERDEARAERARDFDGQRLAILGRKLHQKFRVYVPGSMPITCTCGGELQYVHVDGPWACAFHCPHCHVTLGLPVWLTNEDDEVTKHAALPSVPEEGAGREEYLDMTDDIVRLRRERDEARKNAQFWEEKQNDQRSRANAAEVDQGILRTEKEKVPALRAEVERLRADLYGFPGAYERVTAERDEARVAASGMEDEVTRITGERNAARAAHTAAIDVADVELHGLRLILTDRIDKLTVERDEARTARAAELAHYQEASHELHVLRAEAKHLRECMRVAGLQAFMRDCPPDEVAEHLHFVLASHIDAADKAEAEVRRLTTELDEVRAVAWPGDGHWTREPAEVEGWYMLKHCYEGVGNAPWTEYLLVGDIPAVAKDQRWFTPFPVDKLPSVPEEES